MAMDSIKRVLVPTDLSNFGKIALHYAETFREHFGSAITTVYVNEPVYPLGMVEAQFAAAVLNSVELKQRLEKVLIDYINESVTNPGGFETRVADGAAASTIVSTADEIGADLIIMGTHGRGGWQRVLMGSVTERVLRHTSRPVLTVTPPAAAAKHLTPVAERRQGEYPPEAVVRNKPAIKSILCPVNFTTVAHDALLEASRLAGAFKAELIVMHVVEGEMATDAEAQIGKWVPQEVREHTHYRELHTRGIAAEQVLNKADKMSVDLIVLGAQHKRFRDTSVIGQTSERIVRFARQPVLTVISKGEAEETRSRGVA